MASTKLPSAPSSHLEEFARLARQFISRVHRFKFAASYEERECLTSEMQRIVEESRRVVRQSRNF